MSGRFFMADILLFAVIVLLVAVVFVLFILLKKLSKIDASVFISHLDALGKTQERTEHMIREEVVRSRDEQGKTARDQRQELTEAFKTFGDSVVQRMMDTASMQKAQLDAFSGQLASFAKASGERLDGVRAESATGAKQLREEVVTTLKSISETMAKTMKDLAVAEKVQLEAFSGQIALLTKTSGEKLDGIRTESATGAKQLREEVIAALKGITEATTKTMGELANLQKTQLEIRSEER